MNDKAKSEMKLKESKSFLAQQTISDYGQCEATPISLLEQLQVEKKNQTNTYNKRMRELNRAISLIENTNAEEVIKEVREILSN